MPEDKDKIVDLCGAMITPDSVKFARNLFPASVNAIMHPAMEAAIESSGILIEPTFAKPGEFPLRFADIPLIIDPLIPDDEIHMRDSAGNLLKIIHVGKPRSEDARR